MARRTTQLRLIPLPQSQQAVYDLDIEVDRVTDLASFTRFVRALRHDYFGGDEEWANEELDAFLMGLSGAAEDLESYKGGTAPASWRTVARLLLAATVRD